ncbi:hypothetical protein D3C78_1746370 [compost metagenome]
MLADNNRAFCAGVSFLNRAISSISAGGMFKQIHHSIMLSMVCAAGGKSARFCVASQNQAPSLRHIFVPLTTNGASSGLLVMIWPSSVTMMIGRPKYWSRSAMLFTVFIRLM